MRRPILAGSVILAAALAMPAFAQSQRDQQEQYCTGDAFRLCASEIPNEDRIEACMARQKHLLSVECRAVFDDPTPVARTAPDKSKTRKPVSLAPQ